MGAAGEQIRQQTTRFGQPAIGNGSQALCERRAGRSRTQRLHEQAVGQSGLAFEATGFYRVGLRTLQLIQEFLGQTCLTDARLSHERHDLAIGLHTIKSLPQACHLSISSDERDRL